MKKDGLFYTIIFSFIITFLLVFLLALSHEVTKDRVAAYREVSEKKAVLSAFNIPFTDNNSVKELYDSEIKLNTKDNVNYYSYDKDGKQYYGKEFYGNGLWGSIKGVIAVNSDISKILGLEIVKHNETPGLGGRIEEDWFLDQFKNETIIDSRITTTTKGGGRGDQDSENGLIDAIAGATQTTKFLEVIVNNEIAIMKKIIGDANGK